MTQSIEEVQRYWNEHLNLTQFVDEYEPGSDAFYEALGKLESRYDYKKPLLEAFARDAHGKKLLEIGCGLGVELAALGEFGFQVVGVDLAPRAVEIANALLARRNVDGEAYVQNAEQLDFEEETFEAAYSSGVLQHTPNMRKAVNEIYRVLKPGGRILVILYHRRSWFYLLHRLSGVNVEFESADAPIVRAFTRKELHELFSDFRDVEIRCEYYYPVPTKRAGHLAAAYNRMFVPLLRALPVAAVRRFGWHLVLTGTK